ncbi:ParB/RepB/Spo0J family partition protein [Rhodobacteraceae bacterium R_SAG8]|nr:ParB/RepB/Spo0J family partition protein [Rhodobacteraceae bacterium R_SAG8]
MTYQKNNSLSAIAAAERAPSEKLAAANFFETVLEIFPNAIDDSTGIKDRYSHSTRDFDGLKESIERNGQQQPILIGSCDPKTGKYPIIAGRNRLRVASLLGISLKAIVRPIDGEERLLAQLQENISRRDYTVGDKIGIMIELKKKSFKQVRIAEMMSVSKTDISKLLGLYEKLVDLAGSHDLPRALLASKAGRPKWENLAKTLEKLPHGSRSKICEKVVEELKGECGTDPISFAMAAIKDEMKASQSVTDYLPLERLYKEASEALSNATLNTRDLCELKYEGDPLVNALLQKAIQIEHATLKAMIIERFEVLVAKSLGDAKTRDRGMQ